MPGTYSVHLTPSVPTAMDNGSTHLNLSTTVELLLARQGDERSKEGSGPTRGKNDPDVYDGGVRVIPLRGRGTQARHWRQY